MIRITVELISAQTGQTTTLGKMHISNEGISGHTRHGFKCNYKGQVFRKPDFKKVTKEALVENHPRDSQTVWHLIGKMLDLMGYVK